METPAPTSMTAKQFEAVMKREMKKAVAELAQKQKARPKPAPTPKPEPVEDVVPETSEPKLIDRVRAVILGG